MVYNIKKSDGSPLVSIQDSTQDTTSTSLILPGRNSVNFGLSIDQNFVDLLQNFANTTSPPNPIQGQLWYDSVNTDLKVYDGSQWLTVSIGFDGSSGPISVQAGPNNTDITLIISQYQIVTVFAAARILAAECPDNIVYNDISYAFSSRFPDGIYAGINVAKDNSGFVPYWINGTATYANVLLNSRTISISGVVNGSFSFNGSGNVNVTIKDSNVYVGNTNVTVGGTWTKVLVSDGGRVLEGNNITSSDVVAALGYTPFAAANVNVQAYGNTIVARDNNANFAANVVVANSVIATNSIQANVITSSRIAGTADNAAVLQTSRTIYVDGDIYGNVQFDGSSNVVINSNLVTSGVTAGVYNLVNVDTKGRVTNGGYYDLSPFNSIQLFPSDGYIPAGWAECNGAKLVDTTTGIVTNSPNLLPASSNISVGAGVPLKYYIKYLVAPPPLYSVNLVAGTPGKGPTPVLTPANAVTTTTNVTVGTTTLVEGPTTTALFGEFSNELPPATTEVYFAQTYFENTEFEDVSYYDAVALIMGLGDTNGIMFSAYDVWNNLETLTVSDIVDNLHLRATQNLPACAGKYMLSIASLRLLLSQINVDSSSSFSPLFQDNLMSLLTNQYSQELLAANIPPVDNTLFGCHYLGSAGAWVALAKGSDTDSVADILHKAGFYTSPTSNLSQYTKEQFYIVIGEIVQTAKQDIQDRRESNYNVIVSGQQTSTGNTNVIVSSATVNGYKIGSANFVDMRGGYFSEYDLLTNPTDPNIAIATSSISAGSAGGITVTLQDAGAAALAGVLQAETSRDQAGIAQIAINRTGAAVTGQEDYTGRNVFDIVTTRDAFSAMSAAIFGPNADIIASEKYGGCYVNVDLLRGSLALTIYDDFVVSLTELFNGILTPTQLNRIWNLRQQVYINGSELQETQSAISGALNFVPSNTPTSDVIIKPFGANTYGYVTISPLSGFFVANSIEAVASVPAPSPDALLNRLKENLVGPNPFPIDDTIIENNESNSATGGNTVSSGNTTVVSPPEDQVSNKSDQPSSGNVGNWPPVFPKTDGKYWWWSFTWW